MFLIKHISIFYTVITHLLFYNRIFENSFEFSNVDDVCESKVSPPIKITTVIKLYQLPPLFIISTRLKLIFS